MRTRWTHRSKPSPFFFLSFFLSFFFSFSCCASSFPIRFFLSCRLLQREINKYDLHLSRCRVLPRQNDKCVRDLHRYLRIMQGDEMANIKFSLDNSPSIWNHFLSFSFSSLLVFLCSFIISFRIHKVTASFIVTGLSPSPAGLHRHSPKKSKQPTTTTIIDIPRIDHDVLACVTPARRGRTAAPNAECRMPNVEFILSLWRSKCDRRIEYAKKRATNKKKEEERTKIKKKMGRPVFLWTGNGPG